MNRGERICYIYGLKNPLTDEIRYIGKTIQELSIRLSHHISSAKKGLKYYVYNWIRKLLREGVTPELELLEMGLHRDCLVKEKEYIKKYGDRLCNTTNGGESGRLNSNYKWSDTTRELRRRNAISTRKYNLLILDTKLNIIRHFTSRLLLKEYLNIRHSALNNLLANRNLFRKSYYIIRAKDLEQLKKENESGKIRHRKIQISNDKVCKVFNTQKDCANYLNISRGGLSLIVNKKTPNHTGYKITRI